MLACEAEIAAVESATRLRMRHWEPARSRRPEARGAPEESTEPSATGAALVAADSALLTGPPASSSVNRPTGATSTAIFAAAIRTAAAMTTACRLRERTSSASKRMPATRSASAAIRWAAPRKATSATTRQDDELRVQRLVCTERLLRSSRQLGSLSARSAGRTEVPCDWDLSQGRRNLRVHQ